MKRFLSFFLAVLLLCTCFAGAAGPKVNMYAMDGRIIGVDPEEVEAYSKVGWYADRNDVTTTMYALDGRTLVVYKGQVEAHKNVGWYTSKEEVTATMYAMDGRTITVYKAEVPAYQKVGWYAAKEEVTATMYAMDGRTITVYKAEVPAYKKVGWYETKEEVTATVCARDGRKATVYKNQVADYVKVGWIPAQSSTVDPTKPMVAITYDDGPHATNTKKVLDVLELYNARATFFVLGSLAATYPDTVRRMSSLGCQIGNHTWSHPDLTSLSAADLADQLTRTANTVKNITGNAPTMTRPPYGSYNGTVQSIAGMPLILWSVDTLDWKHRNTAYVTNAVLSRVKDGDIVLMHDIHPTTAAAAEQIIPELLLRGFQLVTVEELARYKGITLTPKSYTNFK